MRQSKSVKEAGPFYVTSHSQGRGIVSFEVYPAFPEYDSASQRWAKSRYEGMGGGPGIFTSIGTAEALEAFLNSVYPPTAVKEWERHIKTILSAERKNTMIAECETCCICFTALKTHNYCPVCGNKIKKSKIPK